LIVTVLSADQENDPDILAVIGSSVVLSISEVPFAGPVSTVHIGYINDNLVLNPTLAQLEDSLLDLVVASTKEAIVMVEAGAQEASEDIVTQAIKFGHEANQDIIKLQEQLQQACGKPKIEVPTSEINPEVVSAVSSVVNKKLTQALNQPEKPQCEQALSALKKELVESLGESFTEEDILSAFETKVRAEIRISILEKGQRVNGRGLTEVRPLSCEVGLLPRTHGSALFTRGRTQVLTITTLGPIKKEQQLDGLGIEETKRFIHHYNFPPFSTGEVKRVGSPGRREIGHGALAERAILPVLPKDEDFPYTIRLVSEVLSSSGSTSMASVCASSLSLMDAGIPIKTAVAGVAMGLITDEKGNNVILTDIDIDNDGTVLIGSPDEEAARKAVKIIEELTKDVEVGGIYTGKVMRLMSFGAFVEILPGKEGLVHISELADYRVDKVEDIVKVGDEITVQVTEIDNMGRVNLSRRAVLKKLSQIPGAGVKDSLSEDYPFRKQREVHSSRHPRPSRNKQR
ncbi:unnamed protein product, partial [marine sediment metagenome]